MSLSHDGIGSAHRLVYFFADFRHWYRSESCHRHRTGATHLEELGQAVAVALLVEALGVQGTPHLDDLEVGLELRRELGGLHVEPTVAGRLVALLL